MAGVDAGFDAHVGEKMKTNEATVDAAPRAANRHLNIDRRKTHHERECQQQ
jgi:hypothetical protein